MSHKRSKTARKAVWSLVLGVVVSMPGIAAAGIVASLSSVAPEAGGFRYTYSVQLESATRLDTASAFSQFFTIYDFNGFIAGTNLEPAGWTFSSANTGATPPFTAPADDPAVPNLTWTWVGGSNVLGPASLGSFSARSAFGPATVSDNFTGQATNDTGGPQDGTSITNIGLTNVPAIPPPSQVPAPPALLLLGIGLAGLAKIVGLRRDHHS